MIADWIITHTWVNVVAVVVLVVLGPPVGAWLAARPRWAWALAGLSLLPVAALTMVPSGIPNWPQQCTVQWALPTFALPDVMANTLLFVPPALLATVASRRPGAVLLAGSGVSAVIELVQWQVVGLARACDTGDWLANSLGAALGVLLGWAALRLHRRSLGRSRVPVGGRATVGVTDPHG